MLCLYVCWHLILPLLSGDYSMNWYIAPRWTACKTTGWQGIGKGQFLLYKQDKKIRGNSGISWRKYKLFSSRGEGWDEGGVWKASWRPLCTAGCFICILLLSRAGGRGDRLWIMNPLQASQAACRTPAAAAWTSKHPAVHRSKHDITCQLLQQCFSVLSISFRNCIIIVQ